MAFCQTTRFLKSCFIAPPSLTTDRCERVVSSRLSVVGCQLSVVGRRWLVVGCRWSVVGWRFSVGCGWWHVTSGRLSVVSKDARPLNIGRTPSHPRIHSHRQLTTHNRQPITDN